MRRKMGERREITTGGEGESGKEKREWELRLDRMGKRKLNDKKNCIVPLSLLFASEVNCQCVLCGDFTATLPPSVWDGRKCGSASPHFDLAELARKAV